MKCQIPTSRVLAKGHVGQIRPDQPTPWKSGVREKGSSSNEVQCLYCCFLPWLAASLERTYVYSGTPSYQRADLWFFSSLLLLQHKWIYGLSPPFAARNKDEAQVCSLWRKIRVKLFSDNWIFWALRSETPIWTNWWR